MMSLVTLFAAEGGFAINLNPLETVSYTHLTLPTKA